MVLGLSRAGRLHIRAGSAWAAAFLLTPLLIFLDIPPAVAVTATVAAQVAGSSMTGVLTYLRRKGARPQARRRNWSRAASLGNGDSASCSSTPCAGSVNSGKLVITLSHVTLFCDTSARLMLYDALAGADACAGRQAGAAEDGMATAWPAPGGWACPSAKRFYRSEAVLQHPADRALARDRHQLHRRTCSALAAASSWCRG